MRSRAHQKIHKGFLMAEEKLNIIFRKKVDSFQMINEQI